MISEGIVHMFVLTESRPQPGRRPIVPPEMPRRISNAVSLTVVYNGDRPESSLLLANGTRMRLSSQLASKWLAFFIENGNCQILKWRG